VNWDVVLGGSDYIDVPSHQSWMAGSWEADDRLKEFRALHGSTPGLDIDAELDAMITDLQAIFDGGE